jgi:hypothetical protein
MGPNVNSYNGGITPELVLAALFQCGWFIAGPIVGVIIAIKRGVHPLIGFALGFLGCIGWGVLFFIPGDKKTLKHQAGRSFSVDETPPIDRK